ncbi:transcriptional regulator NrdR [Lactovum miscens]|uniref:Transcriptional repressor NrdR n=1 Tax=Lactovum miscens TaxID=190387 RepID=A0A841C9Q3_9LACT|nr:transcriptional regulator NrdR [Lactovum miscens]MBB5888312.1 transcriptional repressor NrdR [Lactovum miscens]
MKCPKCQSENFKVLDTRASDDSVRRRRECLSCGYRFTTYERIEQPTLLVVKKDNTREVFDREKITKGIVQSAQKRPISSEKIEAVVEEIEQKVRALGENEVHTDQIGEIVMNALAGLDEITYVRFASVYRSFKDVSELEELLKNFTKK